MDIKEELDEAISLCELQESATPEERLFLKYVKLGRDSRDAIVEREGVKEELEFSMMDGQMFGYGDQYLSWQFEVRNDFDWEGAIKAGDLTKEVAAKYMVANVIRKLVVKKKQDEHKKAAAQQLLIKQANANTLYETLVKVIERLPFDSHEFELAKEVLDSFPQ